MVEQEKTLVSWKGPARPFKRLDRQGMAVPAVIAVLVGVILLVAGEWMLIVVVGALAFAYYMWSTVQPEDTEYILTTRGLRMFGRLYEWSVMTKWWIEERWGAEYIAVESWATPMGKMYLPLGKGEEKKIIEVFEKYLIKEKPVETAVDKMGKWVGEKFPLQSGK